MLFSLNQPLQPATLTPRELHNRQVAQRLQKQLQQIQMAAAAGLSDPSSSQASCEQILEILRSLN